MMLNNENIKVRQATATDIGFIITGQLNLAWETEKIKLDVTIVSKGVKSVFGKPEKGFYIVTEKGNLRCGCLMITPEWSDWRNAWVWWIQSVYVLPEFRKTGIFGMMYAYIKKEVIRQDNVSGIRLYVDNTNTIARKVYTRIGMNDEHYRTFEWMKNSK
ncbi:MAG: GNAT family N-acetyltransferase [Bacteroidota bacterium]